MKSMPVCYSQVRSDIPQAARLLWRARPFHPLEKLIAGCGRTIYYHAGMAAWSGRRGRRRQLDSLELCRNGGQVVRLSQYVQAYPGLIDVYEPNADAGWYYDADAAVRFMRQLVKGKYGYGNLFMTSLIHTPFIRAIVRPLRDDDANGSAPYCSAAVAMADHLGGGVDTVLNLADSRVEPGDLERSLFNRYLFTLFWTAEQVTQFQEETK